MTSISRAFAQRLLRNLLILLAISCFAWQGIQHSKILLSHHNSSSSFPAAHSTSPRILKVSMLYGEMNHMYERALQSHERHGNKWGYPMDVLRQDISVGFWNKPSYLISLVIRELSKPPGQRAEWLMWVDADSIILNGQVPMEIFLPPSDLRDIHLVVSKDQNGLNTGIMFLQVHPWTVTFLSETLGYPLYLPEEDLGRSADQEGMRRVLNKTTGGPNGQGYADGVVYLPRPWINTYEWSHAYEGKKGDLLVHFPGLEEQRWPHMAKWLDIVETTPQQWEIPLENTDYLNKTSTFWSNVRNAKQSIKKAEKILDSQSSLNTEDLTGAMKELKEALRVNTDDHEIFQQYLDSLKRLTGEI